MLNVAKMYVMRIKYAFQEKTHSTHPTQIMYGIYTDNTPPYFMRISRF